MKIYSGFTVVIAFVAAIFLAGCAGGPLTTREKGTGIGALGGAAVGGIIGSTVGRAGTGAVIGGLLGLGAGAVVGDQLQGREKEQKSLEVQIELQQKDLERMQRCLKALQSDVRPLPPGC